MSSFGGGGFTGGGVFSGGGGFTGGGGGFIALPGTSAWGGYANPVGGLGKPFPSGPNLPVSAVSTVTVPPPPIAGLLVPPFTTAVTSSSGIATTAGIPWNPPPGSPIVDAGTLISRVYYEPPLTAFFPPPMIHNYVNVDCMGVYAPVDPHNFAVVNSFFRGGIYTGAVTQTAGNVETVTTPFVQSLYSMKPPVSAVDLNSISYKPIVPSANTMFASPFVNIYGPHGEVLSGTRDASALGLEILGLGQAI